MSEFREILKKAKQQGWIITRTTKSHFCFYPPDKKKEMLFVAGTPGNRKMFIYDLKKDLVSRGLKL